MKKDEMGRACGTQWEEDKFLGVLVGKRNKEATRNV
jgi:hypothetical protein